MRRATRSYLGIDLGTSAVKSAVIDIEGNVLGLDTAEYSLLTPRRLQVECELDTYREAIRRTVRRAVAMAKGGATRLEISGIAISSQGETLVCLDEQCRPVRPVIVWLDNRSLDEASELAAAVPPEELYLRTGQLECVATWTASKILWLQRHEPRVFERTHKFVLLEDWLLFELCGELAGETSLYVSSLLLDMRRREWWPAMLDLAGVTPEKLSPLVEPGTRVGSLTARAASDLGMEANIPVVAGALDQVAAAVGAGNIAPGMVTETTGTILGLTTSLHDIPDRSALLPIYLHAIPSLYCALPYAQTGGLVLRWFRDHFYGPPGSESTDVPYEAVIEEARDVPAGAEGLLFLPHLLGAAYPEYDMEARGAIVGLTLGHGRGHVTRAVLEAIGYTLRQAIEAMRAAGIQVNEITSIGKSADSEIWRQIKADICRLPIQRMRCPESALVGAAMLCAVSNGDYATFQQGVEGMVHPLDTTLPAEQLAPEYQRAFERYSMLYRQLQPVFHHRKTEAG